MQKTKKSIAKRFKVTANGKIIRRSPGSRHLMRRKSTKQKRKYGKDLQVSTGIHHNIRHVLPKDCSYG